MKLIRFALAVLSVMTFSLSASAQQDKEIDFLARAEEEADRLQRILDLEDWQAFYVDSTLKHDLPAMMAEVEALSKAKVSNRTMYANVQDKWLEQIDITYKRIFNEEQWAAYLKNGAAKAQKAREKRRLKAEGK